MLRQLLLFLLLSASCGACVVRAGAGRGATLAPPDQLEAFVPPGSVQIFGGDRLVADVWLRGVRYANLEGVRALLRGPGVRVPSRQMGCDTEAGLIAACPAHTYPGPGLVQIHDDAAWEIDPAALSAGPYRIDVASGPAIVGSLEFSLSQVPGVGGAPQWIVDPRPAAGVVYAGPSGWVAWLPIDGRFRGEHEATIAWYHDGRRIAEEERMFRGRFGTWSPHRQRVEVEAPVLELRPFPLGQIPETTERIGAYRAIVIFDHLVVAGSWEITIAAGPMVERAGTVGMLYEVTGAEAFAPAFQEPGALWGAVAASEAPPALIADALGIPRREALAEPEREQVVCAMASEQGAIAVAEQLGQLEHDIPRAYGPEAERLRREQVRLRGRIEGWARRHRAGCLAGMLPAGMGELLLRVPGGAQGR